MTPINQVKFGQMTMASKLQTLRRNISSRTLSSSNVDKMQTSTWDDAKAAREKDKQTSAQASSSQMNFNQLTDSMGLLNSLVKSKASSLGNSVNTANSNAGGNSVSNSANNYSGIAETGGVSPPSSSSAAKYNTLSSTLNNNDFDAPQLKEYIKNEINPYVSDTQANLVNTKADYNVLLGQKSQAEENVSTLQEQIGTAETAYKNSEKDLSTNESNLESAVQARDQMDEQLSSLNSEYKTSCDDVKAKEKSKSEAQTNVSNCKTQVSNAETAFNSASSAYESAQQALNNTPQTLEDGTPNPAYEAAKTAAENAKIKKEEAQKTLEQAKTELQSAQQNLESADGELTESQNSKKEILQNLTKTESEQSKLAENCLKLENQVETAQQNYDTSLETFDDSKNNYERLNSELESANGILTQCDNYQAKVNDLQAEANKAEELKANAEKALRTKDSSLANETMEQVEQERIASMKREMLEHANSSEGCSASKTPAENLLSMQNGPYAMTDKSRTAGLVSTASGTWLDTTNVQVTIHNDVIEGQDSSYFESLGCISNADGSFTNPENGETYVNVEGDTWVNTLVLGRMDSKYANSVSQDVRTAGIRGLEQNKGSAYINQYIELDKNTGRARLKP